MSLTQLLSQLQNLRANNQKRPLDTFRPLPGQHAVLSSDAKYRMFRGPNQALGKTTAGAVDTISAAIGVNPWCPESVTPFPIEAWILCASWSQSVAIQGKLWELLPKDLLHPETEYTEIRGFRGKSPAVMVRHLPSGGWSIIRIKTTQQGGLNLAGATIHRAWFDEPPASDRVYSEVQKRVMKAGKYGKCLITMTPVNAPVDWIRVAAERGQIEDHHHRLEPAELIPVGHDRPICLEDGTVCDEAWIDTIIAETLPHEIPVVCHGEWNFAVENPIFTAYRRSGNGAHLIGQNPTQDLDLYLGIDHGLARHAQVALLIGVQKPGKDQHHPRVWVIDEAVGDGETTEDDDADAILTMLERHGLRWRDLKRAYGDIPHYGSNRRGSVAKKSNARLNFALEQHPRSSRHGIRKGMVNPPIKTAKRGAANQPGAVSYGCTWLHRLMLREDHFFVLDRCERLDLSIQKYRMQPNSEWSHIIDALRYGLKDWIYGNRRRLPGRQVVIS